LLGLFFVGVGMSLDLGVVGRMWAEVLLTLVAFMAVKALGVYIVARLTGSVNRAAIQRMALFAQGGEFAFVVYAAARGAGILDGETDAIFSAVVILSMAIAPATAASGVRISNTAPAGRSRSSLPFSRSTRPSGQMDKVFAHRTRPTAVAAKGRDLAAGHSVVTVTGDRNRSFRVAAVPAAPLSLATRALRGWRIPPAAPGSVFQHLRVGHPGVGHVALHSIAAVEARPGAGAARDGFVVLEAVIAPDEVVHRALRRRDHPQRAVQARCRRTG
jgi:hypothetical protein